MKLLKDINRRISFHRNKSTDSQLTTRSSDLTSGSPSGSSPTSSADSSPPQSLLVLPDSVHSTTLGSLSFAPIVDNFRQEQTVIYQVVLLQGHIPAGPKPDGTLTVRDARQRSPPSTWPVSQSKFKALVYLHPGINTVNLEYAASGSRSVYRTAQKLMYQPMTSAPPLKLVLLHAKDSKYAMQEYEPDSPALALAKAKYRMAAYLWQTFMAESMNKLGHSRRTFQLESSWDQSTLFAQDIQNSVARNQAPVHVIPLGMSVAELDAMSSAELRAHVGAALHKNFRHFGKTKQYFSCLLLDDSPKEHDSSESILQFGGQGRTHNHINFAVYGGQLLPAYPAAIDEVTSAFLAAPSQSASEASKSRSASLGLGEQLRQIGFMLGLPQQSAGIMSDDCKKFGNVFSSNLANSVKEFTLHPLDAIRLRYNPVLDAPWGPLPSNRTDTGITFWGTSSTSMQISSRVGISAVEIYKPGDELCHYWMDFLSKRGPPRNRVDLSFNDLANATMTSAGSRRASMIKLQATERLRLKILTADGKEFEIPDIEKFAQGFQTSVPEIKRPVFSNVEIGTATQAAIDCSTIFPAGSRMLGITVYHTPGFNMSGIEFACESGAKYLLGSRAAESHKEWPLNASGGETLIGMEANVSKKDGKLCGLRLHSNAARASPWFGAADTEMISYMLIPPETFQIVGMCGKQDANELQSLQFLIDR